MIFNRDYKGNEELRELTGNYYMNNDFGKIEIDIELASEDLIKIIGYKVFSAAEKHYLCGSENEKDKALKDKLVKHIQLPIAIMATLQMYRKNDVSHEDTGRKIKIDNDHEKLPWEWQLKRDDEIHLENYYKAVDRLIAFLEREEVSDWKESDEKKTADSLFIKNAEIFDRYFPIDKSGRLYILLLPFIREVERKKIKPALGDDFEKLHAETDLSDKEKELLEYVYPPITLYAMSLAIRRMPLGLMPSGVIRNYISQSETMNASQPATMDEVRAFSTWLSDDADVMLEDMKQFRNGRTDMQFLPNNDPNNKYMMV